MSIARIAPSDPQALDQASLPGEMHLWSYNLVALGALLLSVPGGFSLALLNWRRMGLHDKVRNNLFLAIALLFVTYVLGPRLHFVLQYWLYFAVAVFTIVYLRVRMKEDIAACKAAGVTVKTANWLAGLGIGLGATLGVTFLSIIVNLLIQLFLFVLMGG